MNSTERAFYGSRWKLSTTLSMNRVVGRAKFYRGFVVTPTDLY
ncbi:hypothetical protein [Leptospira interrogans]|nr:hypothetical protein [Leptospira interrogans]